MSQGSEPAAPAKQPSLLWPSVAVLAWGLLLYQVYVRLPEQTDRLVKMKVPLPDVSRWALDHAWWVAPALGIVTFVLSGRIRDTSGRWLVLAVVPVACLVLYLLIQWLALLQIIAGDQPSGL